jgi:hypothetical protein
LFSSWLLPFSVVAVFSVAADSRSNKSPFCCRLTIRQSLFAIHCRFFVVANSHSNNSPICYSLRCRLSVANRPSPIAAVSASRHSLFAIHCSFPSWLFFPSWLIATPTVRQSLPF